MAPENNKIQILKRLNSMAKELVQVEGITWKEALKKASLLIVEIEPKIAV